jgi:hypothetical protein
MPEMVQAWNVMQMLPRPPGAPAAAMTASLRNIDGGSMHGADAS